MYRNNVLLAVLVTLWVGGPCCADWLRFRGPGGSGIATDSTETPTSWSPDENVKWKTELPGPGVSSPIVAAGQVFVTCYSGYGVDRQNLGEIEDLKRHLICVDAGSGEVVWERAIDAVLPEDPFSGMGVPSHGYASHTPVSDGENVYVFFGKSGVLAFDGKGNQLWRTSVGTGSDRRRWGSSSSPILHDNLVIVTASAEGPALVGLNKATGEEVWRQETEGVADVWGTPLLAKVDEERTDLVLGVPYEFWGLNPDTGKLRWYAEVLDTDQYSSSVVESDGVIYGIEGRGGGSAAVRLGGKKDVTDSHTVWTGRDTSRFGTPLIHEGRIYFFSGGIANCIRAADGSRIFQERLPGGGRGGSDRGDDAGRGGDAPGGFGQGRPAGRGGGPGGFFGRGGGRGGFGGTDYASPVMAGGKIYYVQNSGTTVVIRASENFELLSTNEITEDNESFAATPAISDGKIFVRSDKHLYCIGQ